MTASPSTPKAWVARRMRVASSTSTAVGLCGPKRRRAASSGAAAGIGAGGRAERAGAGSGCGAWRRRRAIAASGDSVCCLAVSFSGSGGAPSECCLTRADQHAQVESSRVAVVRRVAPATGHLLRVRGEGAAQCSALPPTEPRFYPFLLKILSRGLFRQPAVELDGDPALLSDRAGPAGTF